MQGKLGNTFGGLLAGERKNVGVRKGTGLYSSANGTEEELRHFSLAVGEERLRRGDD